MFKKFFQVHDFTNMQSLALLALRLAGGIAFVYHGYGKIQAPFSWMGAESGTPAFLQFLAALSEFGGGIAWIIGLLTPLASLGIASTMVVAVHLHSVVLGDHFVATSKGESSYELAMLYLCVSLLFVFFGAGKYSLDYKLFKTRNS